MAQNNNDSKLKMHSPDLTQVNIAKLAELFPNCVTESRDENGKLRQKIDFDQLRQELSDHVVEGSQERYRLDWPGKREALLAANAPIAKTFRPYNEESVDFDTTQNLFIEGDNLDALKLLQETYLNSVKMIYIDPPYNTGNEYIYCDDYTESTIEYLKRTNQANGEQERLVLNVETKGRFHSDWLSMMYPRLKLARNLLRNDGVLFISIDDNEIHNLKKVCHEIFGEDNFISTLVWEKKKKGTFLSNTITNIKEYVLVYSKQKNNFSGLIGEVKQERETYPCINASNKREIRHIPAGIKSNYREKNFYLEKGNEISVTTMNLLLHSDLVIENGILAKDLVIEGNWRYTQDKMKEYALNNELYITQDLYLRRIVENTRYKTMKDILPRTGDDADASYRDINYTNLFEDGWGSNEDGAEEIRTLLGKQSLINFPKPRKLIEKLIASIRDDSAIVMDFFAGSCPSAHAVLDLNSKDCGNRKFIMIQLPEHCEKNTEAYECGYYTIAEIGKERIRRAGQNVISEANNDCDIDVGFRVLKIDTSNMQDVYYTPDQVTQRDLFGQVNNIKIDRIDEDLLFQVLLDWGVDLTLQIQQENILGKKVYFVDQDALAACFQPDINEEFIKKLAESKPLRAVFRDTGFDQDSTKINVVQIFKLVSPSTEVKTI